MNRIDLTHDTDSEHGRILIMDDDDMIRNLLNRVLTTHGYIVELAEDGGKALNLYKAAIEAGNTFDAVILDLTVPVGMGGLETARELIKIDPKAVLIVSSGYSDNAIMSDFRSYGFSGIVTKPYRVEDLISALKEIISESQTT